MSAYRAPAPLVASGRQWSPLVIKDPHAQDIFRWARGGSDRACTLARIPCSTTVPSTKATQNATQVVALSALAGPPGPSRSCYVLRVRVFDLLRTEWRVFGLEASDGGNRGSQFGIVLTGSEAEQFV